MPNRRSRSWRSGLKNVHWSPSKSVRSVPPRAASGSCPARVDELDHDVGVTVGLGVVTAGIVQPVRTVGVGVESEQAEHAASYAVFQSCARISDGQRAGVASVSLEQRERDALQAEADACRVSGPTVRTREPVQRGEVLAVEVERRHRRRLDSRDRDDELELELLGPLAPGEDLSRAPEEGVGRDVRAGGEAEPGQDLEPAVAPPLPPVADAVRRPEAHQLTLVKGLHPGRIARRLVPEHVGAAEIERDPVRAERAAGGDHGIAGIARGRDHDELGLLLEGPEVLVLDPPGCVRLVPGEREDRSREMREGGEVADLLELAPGHHGRKGDALDRPRRRRSTAG